MNSAEDEEVVRGFFQQMINGDQQLVEIFTSDVAATLEDATVFFDQLIPEMPYVENPQHAMANSMFFCSAMLAVYLALRGRGVDVHAFGNQVLALLARQVPAAQPVTMKPPRRLADAALQSQSDAKPGEFVFEVYEGDHKEVDWGMNVRSCAICTLFSKHDAMDLVPYMCATDDVMSDLGAQGLQRSGSIAVGAHQCDFVYKSGGEARRLAAQYPEKIRLVE